MNILEFLSNIMVLGFLDFIVGAILTAVLVASTVYTVATMLSARPQFKLNQLKLQDSTYGVRIPKIYGTYRISGNIIFAKLYESSEGLGVLNIHSRHDEPSWATATFAIGICKGPIKAVTKIWADNKLIYDVSPTASFQSKIYYQASAKIRIYLGTSDQPVDPIHEDYLGAGMAPAFRNMAYVQFGTGLTAHWRDGFNIEPFGNRIPRFEFEVVTASNAIIHDSIWEDLTLVAGNASDGLWEARHSLQAVAHLNNLYIFCGMDASGNPLGDVWKSSEMKTWFKARSLDDFTPFPNGETDRIVSADKGPRIHFDVSEFPGGGFMILGGADYDTLVGGAGNDLYSRIYTNGKQELVYYTQLSQSQYDTLVASGDIMPERMSFQRGDYLTKFLDDRDGTEVTNFAGAAQYTSLLNIFIAIGGKYLGKIQRRVWMWEWSQYANQYGSKWVKISENHGMGYRTDFHIVVNNYDPENSVQFLIIGGVTHDDEFGTNPVNKFDVWKSSFTYKLRTNTTSSKESKYTVASINFTRQTADLTGGRGGSSSKVLGAVYSNYLMAYLALVSNIGGRTELFSSTDGITWYPLISTYSGSSGLPNYVEPPAFIQYYDNILVIGGSHVLGTPLQKIYYLSFDVISYGSVTLPSVLTDIAVNEAGLDVSQVSTEGLDGEDFYGYAIVNVEPPRNSLEPLQMAYQFNRVESGGKVCFRKRTTSVDKVIPEEDLGVYIKTEGEEQELPEKLIHKKSSEDEIPVQLDVRYISADHEYEFLTQSAYRIGTTNYKEVVELPIVLTDDQAKKVAATLLDLYYYESNTFETTLGAKHLDLEPGDVIQTTLDSVTYTFRIVSIKLSRELIMTLNMVLEDLELYGRSYIGAIPSNLATTSKMEQILPTQGFIVDAPIRGKEFDDFGFYVFGIPTRDNNNNLEIWKGFVVYEWQKGTWKPVAKSTNLSILGKSLTVLADGSGWDLVNTLDITINGTLQNATETGVDNGSNWLIVGSQRGYEVIGFRTVTDNGDGTYTLSNLKRGLLGTTWMEDNHIEGEYVYLFKNYARVILPKEDKGVSKLYSIVSNGEEPGGRGSLFTYASQAEGKKPYPPTDLTASRLATARDIQGRRYNVGSWLIEWFPGDPEDYYRQGILYKIEFYDGSTLLGEQLVKAAVVASNTKPFFVLPDTTYTFTDTKGNEFKIAGQDELYSGITSTLKVRISQYSEELEDYGHYTEQTFTA